MMDLDLAVDFYQSYDKMKNELQAAYEEKDWQQYAILAHSLKSLARTLKEEPLAELAFFHEKAGKTADEAGITGRWEELIAAWQESLFHLEEQIGKDVLTRREILEKKQERISQETLERKLKECLTALEAYDDDAAGELLKELLTYSWDAKVEEGLQAAYEAIRDFEYAECREKIAELFLQHLVIPKSEN